MTNKDDFYKKKDAVQRLIDNIKQGNSLVKNKKSIKKSKSKAKNNKNVKSDGKRKQKKRVILSEQNKNNILAFYEELRSAGHAPSHIYKTLYLLNRIVMLGKGKDLKKMTKDDIKKIVTKLEESEYSDNTIQNAKVVLKVFYKWAEGIDIKEKTMYPERVRWIKATRKDKNRLPETILTSEEVNKMIHACNHVRDKAFISVLYESGCRIGELLGLQLKAMTQDEKGLIIIVDGKTGMRRIRLVRSLPYMNTWLKNHPYKDKDTNAMWCCVGSHLSPNPVSYFALRKMLKGCAERAKITKKVNPHSFRHAQATFMADKITEQQLKSYFGWTPRSDMPGVYVHLSGKNIDDAILAIHGLQDKREINAKEAQTPIKCEICGTMNPFDEEICIKCARPLSVKFAIQLQDKKDTDIASMKAQMETMQPLLAAIGKDPKLAESLIEIAAQQRANEIIEEKKKKQS